MPGERSSSERYEANCDRRFRMHYRNGYVAALQEPHASKGEHNELIWYPAWRQRNQIVHAMTLTIARTGAREPPAPHYGSAIRKFLQ